MALKPGHIRFFVERALKFDFYRHLSMSAMESYTINDFVCIVHVKIRKQMKNKCGKFLRKKLNV